MSANPSGGVPAPVAPAPAVTCTITANPLDLDPATFYGVARRYNPRRSALFVSKVLGKHVPAPPAVVAGAGRMLADRVAVRLDATERAGAVVLAFAETATALGHLVRDGLSAPALVHTTRAHLDRPPLLSVEEEHSHATEHRIYHRDPEVLAGTGPLVLVDDELTTGRTMLNTIAAVHARHPRPRYLVAALLDWRDDDARHQFATLADRLGTRIEVVAMVTGRVHGELVDGAPPAEPDAARLPAATAAPEHHVVDLPMPPTARLGWGPTEQAAFDAHLPGVAGALAGALGPGTTLCVGTEELMYVPLRIAEHIAAGDRARPVRYQSTTRSPIVVADVAGYPVRQGLRFAHHDEPGRVSRLYNVVPGAYDDVMVFVEGAADRQRVEPMAAALAGTGARVHVVSLVTARSS
jgi:hypothetical protein